MKIVDNQAEKWRLCYTCPACRSALELAVGDIRLFWSSDSNGNTFGFHCEACKTPVTLEYEKLPVWVRNDVCHRASKDA